MKADRKLSEELKELLTEARALMDLKSEFGRIPNSTLKDVVLRRIDDWFESTGLISSGPKQKTEPTSVEECRCNWKGAGIPSYAKNSAMVDQSLSKKIPF